MHHITQFAMINEFVIEPNKFVKYCMEKPAKYAELTLSKVSTIKLTILLRCDTIK